MLFVTWANRAFATSWQGECSFLEEERIVELAVMLFFVPGRGLVTLYAVA